jgi:hypothetical protein
VVRNDMTPAEVPWTCTRGDTTTEIEFTLERNGVAWNVDSAVAQVRQRRNRTSTLVLALTTSVAGAVVSVGDGDSLAAVDPGVYYWDLEVVDGTDRLTICGGTFQVLDDVTLEVVP